MTDNFDIIKDFLTPKEIIVEEVNPNHSKIILEPLISTDSLLQYAFKLSFSLGNNHSK